MSAVQRAKPIKTDDQEWRISRVPRVDLGDDGFHLRLPVKAALHVVLGHVRHDMSKAERVLQITAQARILFQSDVAANQ